MYISFWLWIFIISCIIAGLGLQTYSVYLVNQARNTRKGVTTTVIGQLVFNLIVSVLINALPLYFIYSR